MNNRITAFLVGLSNKTKWIATVMGLYFVLLITYDFMKFQRTAEDVVISYICVIIVCVVVWFGVRGVFWTQIKNTMCSERVLNVFTIIALAVFGFSSIVLGIQYLIDGFLVAAFVSPIAVLSIISVQKLRV